MPTALSEQFLRKIALAFQEEEEDIYVLGLYLMDSDDLNYFDSCSKERIKKIFQVLMEDTRYHSQLLKLIVEMTSK